MSLLDTMAKNARQSMMDNGWVTLIDENDTLKEAIESIGDSHKAKDVISNLFEQVSECSQGMAAINCIDFTQCYTDSELKEIQSYGDDPYELPHELEDMMYLLSEMVHMCFGKRFGNSGMDDNSRGRLYIRLDNYQKFSRSVYSVLKEMFDFYVEHSSYEKTFPDWWRSLL